MEIIRAYPGEMINIGRKGENLARQVQIDLTEWVDLYGEGKAELLYQRPQDVVPYPVPIERQGNSILWTITNTDTAQAGRNGRAEIRYYVEEVLVILEISYIMVENTLENPGELPEPPGKSWFDQMLEQVKRVNAPSLNAPILNEETGTWMIWSQVTERYENTNFPATGPTGPQGRDGVSPTLSVEAESVSGGVKVTMSVQQADGTVRAHVFEVQHGKRGQDGANGQSIMGPEGPPGPAGVTPHIGSNGNWWIGETDTGVSAAGGAGSGGEGGVNFTTDESLKLDPETGVLSVNTADQVEQDNTLPITSAAVFATVGNIEALLKTI